MLWWTLTGLLVTMFEGGVINRNPNQVRFVLVGLGRSFILQIRNFCLVLLPNVDPSECQHRELSYEAVS